MRLHVCMYAHAIVSQTFPARNVSSVLFLSHKCVFFHAHSNIDSMHACMYPHIYPEVQDGMSALFLSLSCFIYFAWKFIPTKIVCMYICMYSEIIRVQGGRSVLTPSVMHFTYMLRRGRLRTATRMILSMMYVCVWVWVWVCVDVCVCVYVYVCLCVFVCVKKPQ